MTFEVSSIDVAMLLFLCHDTAFAELEPKCVEDSPERRGEFGCSYIEDEALPRSLTGPENSALRLQLALAEYRRAAR